MTTVRQKRRSKSTHSTQTSHGRIQNGLPDDDLVDEREPLASEQKAFISRPVKIVVSLVLGFHVAAVFLSGLSVRPASQAVVSLAGSVRWYTDATLVNPGYRFFAPDPGRVADMMHIEITPAEGEPHIDKYPHLQAQWPRLRYHRHFMLASRLAGPADSPEIQALARSYLKHAATAEKARAAQLFRVEHVVPRREEVLAGATLAEARWYQVDPNPVGSWYTPTTDAPATMLELRLSFDGQAVLDGQFRGRPVKTTWFWNSSPDGVPRLGFFAARPDGTRPPDWTADWPRPHELMLHYPRNGVGPTGTNSSSGAATVDTEDIFFRRPPQDTPLATYAEDRP